ncbi:MAG TPA: protein phosphatase 2C domain-containing protein [Polyangiaceae bacterium]|nr:protein phosphatase 2C domain-containing protein [Polyangiaceae bacterium]
MNIQLQVAARTDIGQVRIKNEDAYVAVDLTTGTASSMPDWQGTLQLGAQGLLLAVSDGMGGAQAGEVASGLVLSSLAESLASKPVGRSSSEQIIGAVEEAHHAVWQDACAQGMKMGATVTAVYIRGGAAYVAEVGDSRAYLIRAGRITQLTKDQSYVQLLVDAGAVRSEDAQLLPMRNVILQAMGHQPTVSVALGRLELRHLDCLLLCSDGLSTKVSDDALRDVVLTSPDLESAAKTLIDLGYRRGGEDNATVLLAGVGGDLPAATLQEPLQQTFRVLETFDAPAVH